MGQAYKFSIPTGENCADYRNRYVTFALGFSWRGPLAYGVNLKVSEPEHNRFQNIDVKKTEMGNVQKLHESFPKVNTTEGYDITDKKVQAEDYAQTSTVFSTNTVPTSFDASVPHTSNEKDPCKIATETVVYSRVNTSAEDDINSTSFAVTEGKTDLRPKTAPKKLKKKKSPRH
ncbi:hypothetical protein DPMN_075798 [Dreissena polymorpha]|uniref:Uncharacterized protein n=1 Tax=Dreissena polymorpha TaxID=45954 RepID=A0A9D4BMU6_DREPO|nr:hypothetical protein DPMN_075798 [Dreissena polymorpha]